MDFRRIRHFVHVAEQGSLSKAADKLNIVQPALSQSIKRLEAQLDAQLFTRSRKGMELTDAGKMFLKSAYGILNQYNRAKENISGLGGTPKGLVSIAMTASAINVLTVPLSKLLREQYPEIELNIEEGLAANIQQGFEAGWYDLVVSHMVNADDSIHIESLIEEDLFLTSAYEPSAKPSEIDFKDLEAYSLILPQDQHGIADEISATAKSIGFSLSPSQVKGALHPTLQLVEAGFGHSLLPWAAIFDRIQRKKLVAKKVVNPSITHKVSMIYPAHRPATQATLAVMTLLKKAILQAHSEGKWVGELLMTDSRNL